MLKGFPFPANGKAHVHQLGETHQIQVQKTGFHSLQTGKHMCTPSPFDRVHNPLTVSIPCKRESTCARRKRLE